MCARKLRTCACFGGTNELHGVGYAACPRMGYAEYMGKADNGRQCSKHEPEHKVDP